MKKANRHLHPRLFDPSVYCDGPALSVLSRGVIVRVFRDVIDRCAAPQNPSGAILRDGSSDRSVGCDAWSFVESWKPCCRTLQRWLVGEGFFDDTEDIVAGGASLSTSVEITSNQIHFLVEHHCTNVQQQFLTDTTLLGVMIVDVERCHSDGIFAPEWVTSKRGT